MYQRNMQSFGLVVPRGAIVFIASVGAILSVGCLSPGADSRAPLVDAAVLDAPVDAAFVSDASRADMNISADAGALADSGMVDVCAAAGLHDTGYYHYEVCDGTCSPCRNFIAEAYGCDGDRCIVTECQDPWIACGDGCTEMPEFATGVECRDGVLYPTACEEGLLPCGSWCEPLPTRATAAECRDGELHPTACFGESMLCDDECDWPPPDATSFECRGGEFIALACEEGAVLCGDDCERTPSSTTTAECRDGTLVPTACASGYVLCDGRCNELAAIHASDATCVAGSLDLVSCETNYQLCNPTFYGEACYACPEGATSTGCGAVRGFPGYEECIALSCEPGRLLCDGQCHRLPPHALAAECLDSIDVSATSCEPGYDLVHYGRNGAIGQCLPEGRSCWPSTPVTRDPSSESCPCSSSSPEALSVCDSSVGGCATLIAGFGVSYNSAVARSPGVSSEPIEFNFDRGPYHDVQLHVEGGQAWGGYERTGDEGHSATFFSAWPGGQVQAMEFGSATPCDDTDIGFISSNGASFTRNDCTWSERDSCDYSRCTTTHYRVEYDCFGVSYWVE